MEIEYFRCQSIEYFKKITTFFALSVSDGDIHYRTSYGHSMWSHFISCLKKFIEISFITPTENGPSDEKRAKLSNPQVALSTLKSAYSKNKKLKWKNMNGQFRILFELNGWMRWWEFGLCYPLILKSHRQVHTQPKNEFFIEIYPLDVVLLNFYHPSVLRNSMQKNGHQNTTDEWVNKIKVQYHISHRATKYAKHFFARTFGWVCLCWKNYENGLYVT